MSLIKQIEDAETKDQLEALGKEQLGIEVNKRQGVETIRAELLELAEEQAAQEGVAQEAPSATDEEQQGGDQDEERPTQQAAQEAPRKDAYRGRLLKHRKSGRLFPWTAQLAKKRDMQEV